MLFFDKTLHTEIAVRAGRSSSFSSARILAKSLSVLGVEGCPEQGMSLPLPAPPQTLPYVRWDSNKAK